MIQQTAITLVAKDLTYNNNLDNNLQKFYIYIHQVARLIIVEWKYW